MEKHIQLTYSINKGCILCNVILYEIVLAIVFLNYNKLFICNLYSMEIILAPKIRWALEYNMTHVAIYGE